MHNVTDLCGQLDNSGHTLRLFCCSHVANRYIFNVFQHHNYGFFQLRQLGRFGGDSEVQWETSEERAHRGGRAQQAQQGEDARRAREHLSVQLGVGGGGGGKEELGPAQPIHHKSQVRLDLTFLRPILGLFVNLRQKIKLIERTKIQSNIQNSLHPYAGKHCKSSSFSGFEKKKLNVSIQFFIEVTLFSFTTCVTL